MVLGSGSLSDSISSDGVCSIPVLHAREAVLHESCDAHVHILQGLAKHRGNAWELHMPLGSVQGHPPGFGP